MSCQGSFRSLPKSVNVFFDFVCLQNKSQSALTFPASWHSNENSLPKMCAIQFVSPFSGSRCPSPALESPWVPGHEKSPGGTQKRRRKSEQSFPYKKCRPKGQVASSPHSFCENFALFVGCVFFPYNVPTGHMVLGILWIFVLASFDPGDSHLRIHKRRPVFHHFLWKCVLSTFFEVRNNSVILACWQVTTKSTQMRPWHDWNGIWEAGRSVFLNAFVCSFGLVGCCSNSKMEVSSLAQLRSGHRPNHSPANLEEESSLFHFWMIFRFWGEFLKFKSISPWNKYSSSKIFIVI